MANQENPLDPPSGIEEIPIIGKYIKTIIQFFRAGNLFLFDPIGWSNYIKEDRWALRSLSFAFISFFITYPVMRLTILPSEAYSRNTISFANVLFIIVFSIFLTLFTMIFGNRTRLSYIISGFVYIFTITMPLYWINLVLKAVFASSYSWIGTMVQAITMAVAGLVYMWGVYPLSELAAISRTKLYYATILAVITTLVVVFLLADQVLEVSEIVDKFLGKME